MDATAGRSRSSRHCIAAGCLASATLLVWCQETTIRTTVPLVLVPASVVDQKGDPVSGLGPDDFVLLDNGVLRAVHVDTSDDEPKAAIHMVAVVQTSDISGAALSKIRKVGALVHAAITGESGSAAVVAFDRQVRVIQDFTNDPNAIAGAFRRLTPSGDRGGRMLDAVNTALGLFPKGIGPRKANILLIGESRDRGSEATLPEVVACIQHLGVTLYGLTYSAYLTPFTAKPGEYEPPRGGALDLIAVFTEPARLGKANTTKALLSATGGRQMRFETLRKLERDLIAVGREIHTRYVLSFQAPEEARSSFHQLDVKVRGRPELLVRARPGYWSSGSPAGKE